VFKPSLKYYDGVGDGITDDSAAVQTALNDSSKTISAPEGDYITQIAANSLTKKIFGQGRIKTVDGNYRAPLFSNIQAPPQSVGNQDSIQTAFNGDLSKCQLAIEHRISGDATLGQPTTGYLFTPETAAIYGYLYNTSGHNQASNSNIGRTAATFLRVKADNYGQGDCMAFNASAFVSGAKPNATSFLANPAASIMAGDVQAGSNGVYLNPFEIAMQDNGFDVAGIGFVVNSRRTNETGALDSVWMGFRSQSVGTANIDAHLSCSGKAKIGLDLVGSVFTSDKAAIAMKAGDRIYFNSTNPLTSKYPDGVIFGNSYIDYDTGISGVRVVAGGVASLQVSSSGVVSPVAFNTTDSFKVSGVKIAGARKSGWAIATGTATRSAFDTASVTLSQLAERVKALIDDLHSSNGHGLIGA
jgi:hypothetical protein